MTDRWTFGVEPLLGSDKAARSLRNIAGLLSALEDDDGTVDAVVADLRVIEDRLEQATPVDPTPRVGAAVESQGRVYVDHSRDIGAFDPAFPEYQIVVDGDLATGTVTFPLVFEGPPGIVHGGFLAVFFDCVIQHHNCDVGTAGKTTALDLRYRRPVPLLTELDFRLTRARRDRRIASTGTMSLGDEILCEATMDAVAGQRASLPQVATRRARS